jgi:hypothetical protein
MGELLDNIMYGTIDFVNRLNTAYPHFQQWLMVAGMITGGIACGYYYKWIVYNAISVTKNLDQIADRKDGE